MVFVIAEGDYSGLFLLHPKPNKRDWVTPLQATKYDARQMTTRVRPLLNSLNSVERSELKTLLPPKLSVPEEPEGVRYPAALLAQLADAQPTEQYSLAGCITEELLHHVPADITMELLASVATTICPTLTETHIGKIAASKTTEPYLVHIRETRKKMRLAARGPFRYEE
jgi:hypothetical protein